MHPNWMSLPSPASILAGAIVWIALATPGVGYALLVRENVRVPNGPVRAMAHSGNTIYIGGAFSQVGLPSGAAAAIHTSTGIAQTPYPRVVGTVRAVKYDGNGGWYVGGLFSSVQGQPRNNLAHYDASGNLTSWNPDVNGEVRDIAVFGGAVYVAGLFTSVGGTPRSNAAAIDQDTGTVMPWNCSPDGAVSEIEAGGSGVVYLAGSFSNVGGEPHHALAAVHYTTGAPVAFPPTSDVIEATALEWSWEGVFYAVRTVIPGSAHQVRRHDETGTLPFFGIHTANDYIREISVDPSGGVLVVGGDFTLFDGQPRQRLAAIQVATSDLLSFDPGADGPVRSIAWAQFGQRVVVGGSFTTLGGASRGNLGMLDWGGGVNAWNPRCSGAVWSVDVGISGMMFAGGDFSLVDAVPRSNLAAIDATSGVPLDWSPTTNGVVEALHVSGSTLYVGGEFSNVNGTTRNRAAAVDVLSGALTVFHPNVDVSGPTAVLGFARTGNTLYMTGAFGTVGGTQRIGIAAVDPTTGALQAWNANVNGAVYALGLIVPINGNPPTVFVGGQFTQAGGQPRNNLAAISGSTGLATTWNPSPNAAVFSMVVLGTGLGGINRVYVGGGFSTIAGQPRSCLAWIDATGAATSWAPNPNNTVYALATSGNTVVAAGGFTFIGGEPRNHLAKVDLTSPVATGWDPNATGGAPPGYVYKLLRVNDTIYAGGTFTNIAGTFQNYFAAIWEQTATAVESEDAPEPASWALRAAPNPFRFATTVRFSLASEGKARVTVYDVAGRRIRELHEGWLASGRHAMAWDGRDDAGQSIASGVYFVRVKSGAEVLRSKVYRE